MADAISGSSANQDLAYIAASRRSTNKKTSSVNFEDYITLMVAQLKNQDMYNTADTTEMTSQLAQYSLVSAAETIVAGQNTNYAATLVGKQVTASYEDSMGNLVTNIGKVTGITLYEGEPLVYVNGTPYNLSEIMIIGTTA
ncbi:MAG: flagellar hook capping FlgD N-terminal domain-containing protein, partial [Anaerovoracaceae bacterium]